MFRPMNARRLTGKQQHVFVNVKAFNCLIHTYNSVVKKACHPRTPTGSCHLFLNSQSHVTPPAAIQPNLSFPFTMISHRFSEKHPALLLTFHSLAISNNPLLPVCQWHKCQPFKQLCVPALFWLPTKWWACPTPSGKKNHEENIKLRTEGNRDNSSLHSSNFKLILL